MKDKNNVTILAIETSFDDTAAAVLQGSLSSEQPNFAFLSGLFYSEIETHQKTGGIVPEIAARIHMEHIKPVVQTALTNANVTLSDISHIAVTTGPGLVVSLVVGTEFAKGLSLATGIPLLPTNHMSGHLYSAFSNTKKPVEFPLLAIIVSGGHTMLLLMKNYYDYEVIGNTVDDAAGEAFDKIARLLALPYPGGPEISKLALEGMTDYKFPRPMLHDNNYNFSFSGLKTATLRHVEKLPQPLRHQDKADIALSFENAAVDVIVKKALRAVQEYECKTISLSGGVAANQTLRTRLEKESTSYNLDFIVPEPELCTDNAQMIALSAYFDLRNGAASTPAAQVKADPSWELE